MHSHAPVLYFLRHASTLIPLALVVLACVSVGAGTANAVCTRTFDGGGDGTSWEDNANWSPDGAPGSGVDETICIGGAFAVTHSSSTETILSLEHTSTQPFTLTGGTLTLTSSSFLTIAGLTQTGGTITGSGTLDIAGLYSWSSGTHSGSGVTNANGGMAFSGFTGVTLADRTLNSPGAVTATGGGLNISGTAVFNNNGTFDVQGDFGVGGGVFNNNGTFTKSGGVNPLGLSLFHNFGTLNANSGTLQLGNGGNCGGACNGTFNVAATLAFSGGTFELGAAASVVGAGTVEFSGATVNHAGTHNITGSTVFSAGTTNLTGTVSSIGALTVSGGVANFSSGELIAPVGAVTQSGGTLTGSDTITMAGMYNWSSGAHSGSGVTNANGGIAFSGFTGVSLVNRTLNSPGAVTATGGGLNMSGTAVFNNNGAFDVQGDFGVSGGTFNNNGTFTKSGGASPLGVGLFHNFGTLNANSGALQLGNGGNCGGTCNGTFNATATLTFNGGTFELGAAASIVGAGTVEFANTVTVNHAGTYNITGSTVFSGGTTNLTGTVASIGALTVSGGVANFSSGELITPVGAVTQSGGTLTGSDTITMSGMYNWSSGAHSGTGTTNANGGMAFSGFTGVSLVNRTLNSSGAVTATGGGLNMSGTAVFNNNGTFDVQNDFGVSGGTAFNNNGAFTKSGGASPLGVGQAFHNFGAVHVDSGTLSLPSGAGNCGGACSGTYNVAGTLAFGGGTVELGAAASVAGSGTVEFSGATVNHAGTYNVTGGTTVNAGTVNLTGTVVNVGNLVINAGTINFSSGDMVMADTVTHSGGTLTGTDTLQSLGTYGWSGGSQCGSGRTTGSGGFDFTGFSNKTICGRTLGSFSTSTVTGAGNIVMETNSMIENMGTLDIQSDADIVASGNAPWSIVNSGTFAKTAGGETDIGVDFTNDGGMVDDSGGTVSFDASYTQTSGSSLLCTAVAFLFNLGGGTFRGIPPGPCTITGSLSNSAGTVIAGDGMALPVVLGVSSNYTQGVGAFFNVPLGGNTPGGAAGNHGQLAVTGTAMLDGTMNVTLLPGYTPAGNDTFTVMTYGSRLGSFQAVNVPPLPQPMSWLVNQGDNSVVLTALPFTPPVLNPNGSVNGAGFQPGGAVVAGSIAAVFGTNLSEVPMDTALTLPLPTTLGGATLVINGNMSVPKFFASAQQLNVQIPWELQGANSASMTDTANGFTSPSENFNLAMFAPGLFAVNQQGFGQGAVLINGTATVVAPVNSIPMITSRPAQRGEFIQIYCTGLGPVTNQPATGAKALADPLSRTTTTPTITIGGVPTPTDPADFYGLAPNFAGLYVAVVKVPQGAPVGDAVPVVLTIGGIQSNTVTIAVE